MSDIETSPQTTPPSAESKKLLADAWELATPNGSSPYLALKGVGAFGTASSPSGALYVPMRDLSGELKNLQRLEAPDADGKTIMSRDAAAKAGNVALRFADGEIAASVAGGAPVRTAPPRPAKSPINQGNLFDG